LPWQASVFIVAGLRTLPTSFGSEQTARRGDVTIALVLEAVAGLSGQREHEPRSRCSVGVVQSWSPAVADIIGARRAWMVAMISSVYRLPEIRSPR
jgi:hypothetical protein